MALPHHNEDFCWYNNLKEPLPHYTPLICKTWRQFFILKPRASVITKENLVPWKDLAYCCKFPDVERYYVQRFRNYPYADIEKGIWHWSQEDIRVFRQRIDAGIVHLLLTKDNIEEMKDMLKRIYKGHFRSEGKVEYPLYLSLLETTLRAEDYKDTGKNLTGYRTVTNQFELALAEMWQKAKK